ncbi:TonB-dependent siderophore receptor [Aliarcobacter butzleri]|uniref:TonB-dependent siderophore receptor n=2 Tax=Aliarcobacter butzleri TaxID=28197 RepID=UPI0024DE4255|nr:TonB-dependent siderophore receptor [Aliarcobacter butzleri]MDK2065331.1 TonB-dependent siderophore receptor [Aliarcobacter butzleri]
MKRKSILVAPVLAILLNTSLNAEQFSISNLSLKQAIEEISKKSNMPYMVDGKLLDGKKAPNIKNIEGVENALNEILKDTNLKATIEDGTILIREKAIGQGTVLEPISVNEGYSNGSAENGYVTKEISGVGIWDKRSLQDTPYSMTVIPQELIENSISSNMNQIFRKNPTTQERTPYGTTGGDVATVVIRGFNIQNPIVDGISYAGNGTNSVMMQDIERVEIINGTTGFLYGAGRVGGAVNYITKKPTTKDLRNVTIGSYGNESYYSHIDLGGQFDEDHTFGYRVNALYQDGKLPTQVNTEQKAISLVFDWKPTDNFYTDIKYAYKDIYSKGANAIFNAVPYTNRSNITSNKVYSPDWVNHESNSHNIANNIRWDINDIFTLRTNAMYEEQKGRGTLGFISYSDNLVQNTSNFSKGAWSKNKNYGANVYLDSKFDTGSINHTLTLGYSLNSRKLFQSADSALYFDIPNAMSFNEYKNLSEPDWIKDGISYDGYQSVGTQPRKPISQTQYKNILIGDDIVFNEQWSALVGVNYATAISKDYSANTKYDKSELTPNLSLIYKPIENLTTYATYIEGLEAGTIVGSFYKNEGEILDPYKSKQYEVGAKYSLFDEKALLTASLFRIEKANQYADNTTTPKPTLTQDGEQIHQGIELGITGKVTKDLTIIAGGTFMDLSVEKHSNKAIEGKKPIEAATKMAKLFAEYNIPFVSGLTVTGGAYYTGKRYANALNTDILPSYTAYDAGLRYKTKIDKYPTTFNLNVQNLTDKVYWSGSNRLGDPRTVAFSMKMEF